MSVEHMAMVFAAQGLNGQEKLLLLALTNYTDAHGYCWPGVDRLAEDTGTSPATVKRTTQALIKKNLLRKKRRTSKHGHTITNMYRVNLPALAAMRRPDRRYDDDLIDQLTFEPEPTHTPSDQPIAQSEPPPAQSEPYYGSNRALVQLNLSPNPPGDPSENPSSSSPPSSMTEAVVPRQRTDQEEEEETGPEPSHREAAERLVDELPPVGADQRQPNASLRQYLVEAVEARLAAGWTTKQLQAALTADLGGAVSPGIYRHRLDLLPDTPPAPPPVPATPAPARQMPPWCGRCDRQRRVDVDEHDRTIPCPRCHPDAQASQTAVDASTADHPQSTTGTTSSDAYSGPQRDFQAVLAGLAHAVAIR